MFWLLRPVLGTERAVSMQANPSIPNKTTDTSACDYLLNIDR